MRILLAGNWRYPVYEDACCRALVRHGVDVIPFRWQGYFSGWYGRVQERAQFLGPAVRSMNQDLLQAAVELKPDVVWVWRGTQVLGSTVEEIRSRTGAKIVSYNNDDPFGPGLMGVWRGKSLWRTFIKAIPSYDIQLVYRQVNVPEMLQAGANAVYVLPSYYVPEFHYPLNLSTEDMRRYKCEIVFAGHYEDDGRVDCLRKLVDGGISVRLYGANRGATGWTQRALGPLAEYFSEVVQLTGIDYTKAIVGADMALCFLSRMNRDTYTRRCFEIPACGTVLLSERTADLQAMYAENKEAAFFSDAGELLERTLELRSDHQRRKQIAVAGRQRAEASGYSVDSRMRQLLDILSSNLCRE
jgi:spore maturation protein CgeB